MKNLILIILLVGCVQACATIETQRAPVPSFEGQNVEDFLKAVRTEPVFTEPGSEFVDPNGQRCRVIKTKDGEGLTWETVN